jgi:hypothetical protein
VHSHWSSTSGLDQLTDEIEAVEDPHPPVVLPADPRAQSTGELDAVRGQVLVANSSPSLSLVNSFCGPTGQRTSTVSSQQATPPSFLRAGLGDAVFVQHPFALVR